MLDGRGATNQFLAELVAEDAEAAAALGGRRQSNDTALPDWSGSLIAAWNALRDDRSFGPMGGIGRIWNSSISRYVSDLWLTGSEAEEFTHFLMEIDAEYTDFHAELVKKPQT